MKIGLIARKLNRSLGAIYARICSKKTSCDRTFDAKRVSLPSERLAFAHENSQHNRLVTRVKGEKMNSDDLLDERIIYRERFQGVQAAPHCTFGPGNLPEFFIAARW